MKILLIAFCCLVVASATPLGHRNEGHQLLRDRLKPQQDVTALSRRQLTVGGHADKDQYGGIHVGGSASYQSGSNSLGGHVDYNNPGGVNYGGSLTHNFDNGGSLSGSVDHTVGGGTSYGLSGGKTWSHSDGSQTSLSGGFTHDSYGGNSVGLTLSHSFGKRLAEVERAVRELKNGETSFHRHNYQDNQGVTHVGGGVEHKSQDGKTHSEAHLDHDSYGGTSFGGSFSHTFGKRLAKTSS